MKKKILLALLVATAAFAGLSATRKIAMAAEPGDSCTTGHGRSGYMVASGEGLVCVEDGSAE